MDNEKIESIMISLGFSLYEARAYTALVGHHPITGYELARISGIPRSKIYECIERLDRKKLILGIDENPFRYIPVPPSELIRRLSGEFESALKTLDDLLKEKKEKIPVDYIFNIDGYKEIIAKSTEIITGAEKSLDLSLWEPELEILGNEIIKASERGVSIRILTFNGTDFKYGKVFHHKPISESDFSGRWITIVKDRSEVLTGQCSGERGIVAAWTKNECLVFVSLKYIEHEIIKINQTR